MTSPRARRAERRSGGDRRSGRDRRRRSLESARDRTPRLSEQLVQYATRYFFVVLALLYFRLPGAGPPVWLEPALLDAVLFAYTVLCTFGLFHALRRPSSRWRFRFAMWCDLVTVGFVVANDPAAVPPTMAAFIMVVLGNGMRYGMSLFAEGIVGAVICGLGALIINARAGGIEWSLPLAFFAAMGAIIIAYAYLLMSRIEEGRALLEQHSRMDGLTGLVNRRALFEIADDLFKEVASDGGRLVVMFADMDRFKAVNDTHGHATGDHVLKAFAGLIKTSVRAEDVASRYGGDEFVVVLLDTDAVDAQRVARRIQAAVDAWARSFGVECSVTFGLAEAPAHGSTLNELLSRVDSALYRSKNASRRGGVETVEEALRQAVVPAANEG